MKQEELSKKMVELIAATKEGKIRWSVEMQTTETNDASQKPKEVENGIEWTVDECYVSYYCKYKGNDFCMITYELIKMGASKVISSNMVFLPPLGMRYFDLRVLLPYSIETSAVLLEQIHQLWVLLLNMYKTDKGSIYLNVSQGELIIED